MKSGKISGDGIFTRKCQEFFEKRFGFKKVLMTTSCTDAMEMAAILIDTKSGDEIIMPSYTFVSTANAFVLRGAKIVFADSGDMNPNMDISKIEKLITGKTKAIVVMHYGGIACDMDEVLRIAEKYNLFVIEDAAQSIDSYYKDKPLGSLGHLSAFSFHETKNVISGEGGMLVINDSRFIKRAEIIREKGTNRAAFFRGEVDKYSWVDIGSSFLPSELISAFLFAQLESLDRIQNKRKKLWNKYHESLSSLEEKGFVRLSYIPEYATNNAHLFYIICRNLKERTDLISHLKEKRIGAVFHYISLHSSEYYRKYYEGGELTNTNMYSDCLLRLPMYYNLRLQEADFVCRAINTFFMEI